MIATIKVSLVVFVVLLLGGAIKAANDRDRYHSNQDALEQAYQKHLAKEYIKTICGIEAPKLDGTDNRAGTEKDLACMAGVEEKAKKEVEAMIKN